MQFLLRRHGGALIVYLLSKKIKRPLSVEPLLRQALAWLMSAQRVSRRDQRNHSARPDRGAPHGVSHWGERQVSNCAESVPASRAFAAMCSPGEQRVVRKFCGI